MSSVTTLVDGLRFPEGPRWHAGRLYFSDFYAPAVLSVDLDGQLEHIVEVPAQPSGQAWLPDGTHVVVSMLDARLVQVVGSTIETFADLRPYAAHALNDMAIDDKGRLYVGGMPETDPERLPEVEKTSLMLVERSDSGQPAQSRVVADGLSFPNGIVLTADGKTLIVAETFGQGLTAFDVAPDGTLSAKRSWARLPFSVDGICIDAEGLIWAAVVGPADQAGFCRIREGGEVVERIPAEGFGTAVALGGPDGKTLFMLESRSISYPEMSHPGNGCIRTTTVPTPGVAA